MPPRRDGYRPGLLDLGQQIDRTVLERLEGADGRAELRAHLEVVEKELMRRAHGADRFGAQRQSPGAERELHGLSGIDDQQCRRGPVQKQLAGATPSIMP